MTDPVVQHLMDIKERIARIETTLTAHVEGSAERDAKVEKIDKKVTKAEASLKTLRWIGALIFISVPSLAVAFVKVFGK